MLDFRIATFLKLCETKSYTKTAHLLHITQPSVTQHIKHLEEKICHCKLFNYEGKQLTLRPEGKYLYEQALALSQKSERIKDELSRMNAKKRVLRFGCNKDFGEYIVPMLIAQMLEQDEGLELELYVDSSDILDQMLACGKLDFIFVDGCYGRNIEDSFGVFVVGKESFSAFANAAYAAEAEQMPLRKAMCQKLLLREQGAGTRRVLEHHLQECGSTPQDFSARMVCNTPESLKTLLSANGGITFAYDSCMEQEVREGKIGRISMNGFPETRDLVFIYSKDNSDAEQFRAFFQKFMMFWEKRTAE